MSNNCVWWIDDTPSREDAYANELGSKTEKFNVEFFDPEQAVNILSRNSVRSPPVLVMIDWKLNEHGDFSGQGLTMAGMIREEFPEVPIYGFTGGSLNELETPASQDQFQDTFPVNYLTSDEHVKKLEDDLGDYGSVRSVRGEGFDRLLSTLNPPEEDREDLEPIIPREFHSGLTTDRTEPGGSMIAFTDWVRHRFLETPGPLWDKTWAATKLGLKEDVLDEYIAQLYDTEYGTFTYDGILSHRADRRWWSTHLIAAVVELNQERDNTVGEIRKTAPVLLDAAGDHISECKVCDEQYPQTVAADVEGEDAEYPVHYRCSDVHHTREGSFEDYRIAKPRSK